MFARLARRTAAASAQQWGVRTAGAAGAAGAAAAAAVAVACVGATALCEHDAPAMPTPAMPTPAPASLAPRTVQRATSGLTAAGEVTLEALVGRSLSHLAQTSGTVTVRGVAVRWWRFENEALTRKQGPRPPVVALHGGPAFTHGYIKPLVLLADAGWPVIFYDQAGCGGSRAGLPHSPASSPSPPPPVLKETAPWLFTVEYYVEELAALVQHLGLDGEDGGGGRGGGGYYVYGSSWGSMLAQEFGVTRPRGLLGLVLDGALSDGDVYIRTQWRDRISTMPPFTQRLLRELEDAEAYDSPAYGALNAALTGHFTTRQVPAPECWGECLRGQNEEIYVGMQGASEFTFGGVLKDWSIVERNRAYIRVPTLVLAGEFDTMSQECQQQVVDSIPTAWPLVTIPRAAHCKLLDEPVLCCDAIARFLFTCDTTRAMSA
jgi:proline-specific peptidase